jgi:hypothetical protein
VRTDIQDALTGIVNLVRVYFKVLFRTRQKFYFLNVKFIKKLKLETVLFYLSFYIFKRI